MAVDLTTLHCQRCGRRFPGLARRQKRSIVGYGMLLAALVSALTAFALH